MDLTYIISAAHSLPIRPGEWVEVQEAYQMPSNKALAQVVALRVKSRSVRFEPVPGTDNNQIWLHPHEGRIVKLYKDANHQCFTIAFS